MVLGGLGVAVRIGVEYHLSIKYAGSCWLVRTSLTKMQQQQQQSCEVSSRRCQRPLCGSG